MRACLSRRAWNPVVPSVARERLGAERICVVVLRGEPVSDAGLCEDVLGAARVSFQLASQARDVNTQGAQIGLVGTPHLPQNLPVRHYSVRMPQQTLEYSMLERRELYAFTARAASHAVAEINDRVAEPQNCVGLRAVHGAAKNCPHPCEQFRTAERFDDVIVGTRLECREALIFLHARCQNDDRHRRPGANLLDEVESVPVRKPEIGDAYVGAV